MLSYFVLQIDIFLLFRRLCHFVDGVFMEDMVVDNVCRHYFRFKYPYFQRIFTINRIIYHMELVDKESKTRKETSKDKQPQRRSLNSKASSKSKQIDELAKRGHVSEVLQIQVVELDSANKDEEAIASLEKHRKGKSNNQKSVENVSTSKSKKNRTEEQTVKDGEMWVSACESAKQILSIDASEVENISVKENASQSKLRTRQASKKKTDPQQEARKSSASKQRTALKSKSKQKTATKSNAKSKGKSKGKKSYAKSGKKKDAALKRSELKETDLTNETNTEVEEIKSTKKSVGKQSSKKQ